MIKTTKDLLTGKQVPVVRTYRTSENGFMYEITEEIEGGYIMTIPCPIVPRYQTKGTKVPYPVRKYVQECLDDFGLCEFDREYMQDGSIRIYGN